jgi:putative heme iron utilization protein
LALSPASHVHQQVKAEQFMPETPETKIIRDTDMDALNLVAKIIMAAKHGALAAFEKNGRFPHISRIQISTSDDGQLITLVSDLAPHTACMRDDPHCALLIGETGKGDPLAHPRMSLDVIATQVSRDSAEFNAIRASHLARHPKAKLYVDFPDFSFFKLAPQKASLNGGFGKAYNLTEEELIAAITSDQD